MLYRAKTLVTYEEVLRNPGDTFEVSVEDARKFGWDLPNNTVEAVTETPAPAPEPEQVQETPVSTTGDSTPESDTGAYAPETTEAPKEAAAEGEGDTNNA